jgi:hypothetical protein
MDPGMFDTGAGATSAREGVEIGGGGGGVGAGIASERAAGALVAGTFVATRLSSPGPGRLVFVSVCARRKFADNQKNPRTTMIDLNGLPPYKTVKKLIS